MERTDRTAGQITGAAMAGAVLGLTGGTALGAGLAGISTAAAALVCGLLMAALSAWADATRRPGRPQPLWVRIVASTFLAAFLGWLLGLILPSWPSVVAGAVAGTVAGAMGARIGKILLGLVVGATIGLVFDRFVPAAGWSVVAAAAVAAYRTIAALLYREREQIRFLAEAAPVDEVPYVVPLVEQQGYVGVDYLRRYAERVGAAFTRSPADIGIVDYLDRLTGPTFDPDRVHPLIREFYEHTSRFHLAIVPEWRAWMKVPYLVYRELFARPLGQANAPFRVEEVERGMVSWIDTIDTDEDGVPDFRAWVRAYEETMEPLYVGIYTTFRQGDTGYVSVGFPLPTGSFTATLLPRNHRRDGLLLTSRDGGPLPGHYLSLVDPETGAITAAELTSFHEEIDVYVDEGRLLTDHRFFLGRAEFMALHYSIDRL
jgi:hypothetical protein